MYLNGEKIAKAAGDGECYIDNEEDNDAISKYSMKKIEVCVYVHSEALVFLREKRLLMLLLMMVKVMTTMMTTRKILMK